MSKIYKSVQLNENQKKIITYEHKLKNEPEVSQEELVDDTFNYRDQIIKEAKEQAARILGDAKKQAEELLEKEKKAIDEWWDKKRAEDDLLIERLKKEGYQAGYEEGHAKAELDLQEQYQKRFDQAQQILEEASRIKEQIIQESESKIIELSVAIAEKIIRKEIELDMGVVKNLVKEVLKGIKELEKISISVAPSYFTYLHNAREELLKELNGQIELLIFPDPSITDGGCIIKSSYGTFDAKIDTQLEEIKFLLFDISGRR
ncbi:flagellar assembly protein FliH [Vulcanibacillus modesticaldus]|uniref:Flagellar assembly protein FliH n=1 Tax=Vulcanibacillus modesticaldus TaxID=337097 RepID=A0A1D2YX99_9BACI|nr:flagellar assembly protein FliH [Vulcanibacillus modesticaldus]OEG00401.1 flagellar assembly protein FliH [Vulcanibacillus modesticaldus]